MYCWARRKANNPIFTEWEVVRVESDMHGHYLYRVGDPKTHNPHDFELGVELIHEIVND